MKITLSELKTKNLATLIQRIITVSVSGKYEMLENSPLFEELGSRYDAYDAVYAKQTYSGKGKDVAAADEDRDVAFRNLKAFLYGYHQLPLMPNAAAAKDLYQIFVQFGLDIDRMTYSLQTAEMKKLIETLELPANAHKLTALLLQPAFTDMKTKQDYFESVFGEQASANSDLRKMQSATSIRRELEKSLKSYLDLLNAMKNVSVWKDAYGEIDEMVKAAKGSSQSREKDENENL